MSQARVPAPTRPSRVLRLAEEWLPVGAVVAVGAGLLLAGTGLATGAPLMTAAGGAAATAGSAVLIAGNLAAGLVVLVLSLPLPALVSGDFARITPAAILTAVFLLSWFLAAVAADHRVRLAVLPVRSLVTFGVGLLVATLFARHRAVALRELVNLSLMIGLLVVVASHLARRPAAIPAIAKAVAGAAGVAGAWAGLQAVGIGGARFPLEGTGLFRATAGFGWPNELGMFLALALPLALHVFLAADRLAGKLLALASLAAVALGLAFTFSRGSWLAFLAAAPILLLTGRRMALVTLVGIAMGAVALDLLLGGVLRERAMAVFTDPYVGQRFALMAVGVLMFLAHPIVGVGPGGFAESLADFGPEVAWLWDYVGSSHNAYIEIAAETGVLGLAGFVGLLTVTLLALLRSARAEARQPDRRGGLTLRRALLWSFAIVCTGGFTVWPLAHGIGQLAMLVAAMGLAASHGTFGAESQSGASAATVPEGAIGEGTA